MSMYITKAKCPKSRFEWMESWSKECLLNEIDMNLTTISENYVDAIEIRAYKWLLDAYIETLDEKPFLLELLSEMIGRAADNIIHISQPLEN